MGPGSDGAGREQATGDDQPVRADRHLGGGQRRCALPRSNTSRTWSLDGADAGVGPHQQHVAIAPFVRNATIIARCRLLLVQRSNPNEPVASYWPEFRQAGKGEIPPRWLRSGCGRAAVWLTTHIIRNIGPAATLAGPRCSGPTALRVSSRRRDVSAVRWTTARSTPSLRRRLSVRVWNGYLPQRGQG